MAEDVDRKAKRSQLRRPGTKWEWMEDKPAGKKTNNASLCSVEEVPADAAVLDISVAVVVADQSSLSSVFPPLN